MFTVAANFFWCVIGFLETYNGAITALATFAIGLFTFSLVKVTNRQARLTREAIDLARKDFVATHRPRLRVRFAHGPFIDDNNHQFAVIVFVNIGATICTIEEIGVDLALRDDGQWLTPGIDATPKRVIPVDLESGARHSVTITTKREYGDQDIFASVATDAELCLLGAIKYRDGNDVLRETGFFRINRGDAGFVPSNNPEEEYED